MEPRIFFGRSEPRYYPVRAMPTHVTFDTHFPGEFLAWPDGAARPATLACVDRGELEFTTSLEVLQELMTG